MKTFIKRAAALLLALSFVLLLAGCNRNGSEVSGVKTDNRKPAGVAADSDLVLPYSREEGVNPFSGTTLMNEAIMPLIYDGLYTIDEKYEPTMTLVESIVQNDRTLMLTMNADRRFSDGTVITADDVEYSFKMAKNSVYYGSMLSGIASATASGTTTINFTLEEPNQFATANLTFPIVKEGTADQKDDIPVGSGKYVYTPSDSGGVLKQSDGYKSEKFKAKQIFLLNISEHSALFSSLNIENINAAVDDISDGEVDRITVSTTSMPLNNLVYVGVKESGALEEASVRQALSAVLDRQKILSTGMSGYGVPSTLPLNPDWYVLDGVKTSAMDRTKAKNLLQDTFTDETLKIVVADSNPFQIQTAEELGKQLKSAGVSNEIETLAPAIYKSAVSSGLYDLYIGEYRLTYDMDLSGVLDNQMKSSWQSVMSGTSDCSTFVKGFQKQMPFLTIGFRTGVLAYSRNLADDLVNPLPGNPYAGVEKWELS